MVSTSSSSMAQRMSNVIVPLALVVFALPFLALLFYSLPATDDFCNATLSFNCVPQPSAVALAWKYYTQWSPRWFSTFLQSFVMSKVNLVSAYGWLLLSVIVSNVLGLWMFFRTFFRLKHTTALLASCVFYAAWVATLPTPAEELYWLTTAMGYYLSLSVLLVLLSLLYQPRKGWWYFPVIAVLAFAAPAQHELAGTLVCVVLFAAAVFVRWKRLSGTQWYVAFVCAALSQAIVMLSPGNAVRAAQEHRHFWDLRHSPTWAAHSLYHGFGWLSAPAFLLAAFVIVLITQSERPLFVTDVYRRWVPLAALAGSLFLIAEYFLAEMASGSWAPDRVVMWFEFVFWLFLICAILTGLPEIDATRFTITTRTAVYLLFGIALLGSTNFREAVEDLHGPAQRWWRIDTARLQQRGGVLQFDAPEEYPKLAMHPQLTSDSSCWVNRCLANYLRADSVIVKNSHDECPH